MGQQTSPYPASPYRDDNENFRSIAGLFLARYNGCTKATSLWKGSHGDGELINVNLELVQKAYRPERASKFLRILHRHIGPTMEIFAISGLLLARYNGWTKARCIWKGSYGDGEPKNLNLELVQKANRQGRACKLLCIQHRRIASTMEICATSGLLLARYNGCTKPRFIR